MSAQAQMPKSKTPRFGVARMLSKLGLASRTQAEQWVRAGRVTLNGKLVRDPEAPVRPEIDRLTVDGRDVASIERRYLLLNKPRGLVTTTTDEQGRDTVYRCFDGAGLPWLAPVGRLDKASEGMLLFCNDPQWAARITDPDSGPEKTYHVQIDRIPDETLQNAMVVGITDQGEQLSAKSVRLLRVGVKNAWLEIILDEGRNRQIRRLLAAFDIAVLRLIRVAIGPITLGELAKGQWRDLTRDEIKHLMPP